MVVYRASPTVVVDACVLLSTRLTVKTLVPKGFGLMLSVAVNLPSVVCTEVLKGFDCPPVCGCAAVAGKRGPPKIFNRAAETSTAPPNNGSQRSTVLRGRVLRATPPSTNFAW